MRDDEARELADRITANIKEGKGMTLTPDELASVGGVAGKLHAINERYRVLFEDVAQAFQTAGVKLVDKDGKPTLANIEEGAVH